MSCENSVDPDFQKPKIVYNFEKNYAHSELI